MDASDVHRQWSDRSGEYSPSYYAYYGADETSERLHAALEEWVGPDAAVLELGCSVGRHLAYLHDRGFRDLSGIDINEDAVDVMADTYPDLAAAGTFYVDSIEAAIPAFEDDQFDAVYSVETLQHIHPDSEWVFEEIARVTGDLLVTVEREREDRRPAAEPGVTYVNDEFPLYYRDWEATFADLGLVAADAERIDRDVLRVFRPDG